MKKIAIISYNIYPYLCMPERKVTGGAELQLSTLARKLLQNGVEVIFLTGDFGQKDREEQDGFTFFKIENNNSGSLNKLARFFKLFRKIRPSLILERGTSTYTFPAVLFCRLLGIPFVFCGASDINFAKEEKDPFFKGSNIRSRLYQWSLHHISHFIVQKNMQAGLLKKNFGLERNVTLIRNFPPQLPVPELNRIPDEKIYDAVWVANFIPYKQPEVYIELARLHPQYKFLLIGAGSDPVYNEKLKILAEKVTNLTMAGYVPAGEVAEWMRRCRIVVNTTSVASGYEEGFSNVQLMGWALGLPTLTLISDPDQLISQYHMGKCSRNFEQLCIDFKQMSGDRRLHECMSRNAIRYVKEQHDPEQIFDKYQSVFKRYTR